MEIYEITNHMNYYIRLFININNLLNICDLKNLLNHLNLIDFQNVAQSFI